MRAETHQPLDDFLKALRASVESDDAFGQHLLRMTHQEAPTAGRGLFRQVREVVECVAALGGTPDDASAWATQAFRWMQTGQRVDTRYADFEINPRAGAAMDALIKQIAALPESMRKPSPPFDPPPKTPAQPNPFKPPSPFSSRAGVLGRPTPPSADQTLPYFATSCFEALKIQPAAPTEPRPGPLPFSGFRAPSIGELPTDLQGLLEVWHKLKGTRNTDDIERVLAAIGRLDDMRALDHIYNLQRVGEVELPLLDIFTKIGGNVGAAGLVAMLPINEKIRANWLAALCTVARTGRRGARPLNEMTLDTLWKIAVAESAPNITFCAPALKLLAATGRRESVPILWEHARSGDSKRRGAALLALAEIDPGESLEELLVAFNSSLELLPPLPPFPFGPPPEPTIVGIPFERLEAVIHSNKHTLRASAIKLIGYIDDSRVVPLLIHQLDSRIIRVREMTLAHLRRLKATDAADAVTRLMLKDQTIERRAAEVLLAWDDARCVPVLLHHLLGDEDGKVEDIIKKLGKFDHPEFNSWIERGVRDMEGRGEDGLDALIEIISALAEAESPSLAGLLLKLAKSPHERMRQIAALGLVTVTDPARREALKTLAVDRAPGVAYAAAAGVKDSTFGRTLLESRSKVKRLLGMRVLWSATDHEGLADAARDSSAAIKSAAVWTLTQLVAPRPDTSPERRKAAQSALLRVIEEEDQINEWGFNLAVMAWAALAKQGLLSEPVKAAAD
ncbi:MAG TPA: HEAT repeat domain-containing protein [Aggregatilineales bacterium]|nr:HEAT repeat domain-containing protein [Aggregatilineales bacterium]